MNKIIEINNIEFTYNKNQLPILKNINLNIEKGEMIAIIGKSGIGKSTLFKLLLKSIKPTKGEIKIFNQNIWKMSKKDWKKIVNQIGFLTQKNNLVPFDNVYENIKRSFRQYSNYFYKLFGILSKKQKIQIFETLNELNILDKAFFKVSDLSGGQQQRVEIAKLLIENVDLILADEPTSNLDKNTSEDVLKILNKLKNTGKTILVNIHDLSLVKKYFDRVIILNNKTITVNKNTEEIEEWQLIEAIK